MVKGINERLRAPKSFNWVKWIKCQLHGGCFTLGGELFTLPETGDIVHQQCKTCGKLHDAFDS